MSPHWALTNGVSKSSQKDSQISHKRCWLFGPKITSNDKLMLMLYSVFRRQYMRAVVNVTKIDWDTETGVDDAEDVAAAAALPTGPLSITVDIDDKDEETVLDAVLDHLSDTYGFLIRDVQYSMAGFTADVDESSHYS